jgi:hypothetical protein
MREPFSGPARALSSGRRDGAERLANGIRHRDPPSAVHPVDARLEPLAPTATCRPHRMVMAGRGRWTPYDPYHSARRSRRSQYRRHRAVTPSRGSYRMLVRRMRAKSLGTVWRSRRLGVSKPSRVAIVRPPSRLGGRAGRPEHHANVRITCGGRTRSPPRDLAAYDGSVNRGSANRPRPSLGGAPRPPAA